MKKFLDIFILALLFVLIFNFFNSKDEVKLNNTLNISFEDTKYSIPASVGIKIDNKTSEVVKINSCDNLVIKYAGEQVKFSNDFCKDVEIKSGEENIIDLASEYISFENTGKYTLDAKVGEKEYIDQFELTYSNGIKKIFVGIFYAPLYNLIIRLVALFSGSFGWAIISITIIIRLFLLWPQHKMMLSQKKLQAIQPKIKKLQEEYKGNQQMLGMKMMELYKKEKVNPMGSCGFLLIQMPILIVLYRIILGIKDPSNAFYLYSGLKDFSLESIEFIFYGLDLLGTGGIQGLILAISIAVIQHVQIRLSLAKKDKDNKKQGVVLEKKSADDKYSSMMPDPEMMNKFMLWGMPAMVGVFTFTLIAGVGIYWGISTTFMLFQQLVINRILEK